MSAHAAGLDLVPRTLQLCRALRAAGLQVGTGHAVEALRALREVPLESRLLVHAALRCVLASRPEDFPLFDALFDDAFSLPREPVEKVPRPRERGQDGEPRAPPQLSLSAWLDQAAAPDDEDEPEAVPGLSDLPALAQKDFRDFAPDDLDEIERIARRLARRLAARPSRRWKAARRGPRIDLRRTVRRSVSTSGEAIQLCRRTRRPRRTRLVALCDVSGSMDLYARFLLQFLYALSGSWARVESFVFSTELVRVTEALRERSWQEALRRMPAQGWSGGTRIGAALAEFAEKWDGLVDGRTVVIVLSDGWDTGDPAQLAGACATIRLRARRLVWLNPLLGSPGYEPLAAGMQAALPHLDAFAPVHNLASLRALEAHLLR